MMSASIARMDYPRARGSFVNSPYADRGDAAACEMINFPTPAGPGPGFEAGWMKVQHTVEVIDADHIESAGTNTFYRLNGEIYRTGCSTATGTRFE